LFRIEWLTVLFRGLIELRGGFELALLLFLLFAVCLLFPLMAFLLQNAEFGGGFVGTARKACLLKLETAKLLFVREEGVDLY
jgi:hypothetical protein